MIAPRDINSVVIFGGGGLVGHQICRLMSKELRPKKIVVCTLFEDEAKETVTALKEEFGNSVEFIPEYGNIFVRESYANKSRAEITSNNGMLAQIYDDVFGDLNGDGKNIVNEGLMPKLILKYRPDVVIDCVNTATAISYQDVKSSSKVVKEFQDALTTLTQNDLKSTIVKAKNGDKQSTDDLCNFASQILELSTSPLESFPHLNNLKMIDLLLISQSVPQLVRHVTLLYNSLLQAKTRAYIKVGTTGTGGMGVNIPFTHGEDKPSFTLMTKTSIGFAHTGLLFLLARSPGPIIKEIKPGAMIGHKRITFKKINKFRQPVVLCESKEETVGKTLTVRQRVSDYKSKGNLELVGVDTGENGFFSRGEYEAITYMDSMEFVTPEEIARNVLYELCGHNTGKDVIAAIDGAVMDPSYRAGYIRQSAIDQMLEMENSKGIPSIAIGELGPPQLSKLLYEAYLLQSVYPTLEEWADRKNSPEQMSKKVVDFLNKHEAKDIITSLGLSILLPDGKTIVRGHTMYIPESKVHATVDVKSEDLDSWAKQGWIDLRNENFAKWKERAKRMIDSREQKFVEGSAAFGPAHYTSKSLKTGEIVGWILSTEFDGSRQK